MKVLIAFLVLLCSFSSQAQSSQSAITIHPQLSRHTHQSVSNSTDLFGSDYAPKESVTITYHDTRLLAGNYVVSIVDTKNNTIIVSGKVVIATKPIGRNQIIQSNLLFDCPDLANGFYRVTVLDNITTGRTFRIPDKNIGFYITH